VAIKTAWKTRLEQIIEALNEQGMVCILGLFYQRQDYWLASEANYTSAMQAVTDWLILKGYRNVVINLANECGEDASSQWGTTAPWASDSGVAGAIEDMIAMWAGEPWRPAVSASDRRVDFGPLAGAAADLILPHGNLSAGAGGTGSPTTIAINALMAAWPDKPVVMDEDSPRENGDPSLTDGQAANETTCTRMFDAGGSYGAFMSAHQRWHSDWNDDVGHPFEFGARATADMTTGTFREQSMGMTRAMLDHIETLTGGLDAP
jgi:hypothetical protein